MRPQRIWTVRSRDHNERIAVTPTHRRLVHARDIDDAHGSDCPSATCHQVQIPRGTVRHLADRVVLTREGERIEAPEPVRHAVDVQEHLAAFSLS